MKLACAFLLSIALADVSVTRAQEVHEVIKGRAVLNGYVSALTKRNTAYFYGLYVDNDLTFLDKSDSITITRFLSTRDSVSGHRGILIARIPDLDRLNNLNDTVLVYGPNSMAPYVRGYAPPPQPRRVAYKHMTVFRWLSKTFVNSIGFSPSGVAYGRWYTAYSMRSLETNPNALPYYMTRTNTNKYLHPFDK